METQKIMSQRILSCYNVEQDELIKGRTPSPIGTRKEYNNEMFEKVEGGKWKYIGKVETVKEEVKTPTERVNVENQRLQSEIKKWFNSDNAVIDKMLDAVQPQLQRMIKLHKDQAIEEDKPFTQRDQEYLELQYVAKMVQSVGDYIKNTDDIKNMRFNTSAKGFEISAHIVRNGQSYPFRTEAIGAGGYNIQVYHYRYLTDTTLPRIFNKPIQKLEARINYLKTEDRLRANLQKNEDEIVKYQKEIDTLNAKEIPGSFDSHRIDSLKRWIKDDEKKRPKLQQKLDDHLSETLKYENPQEGDVKVSRDKQNYGRHPGIHVHEFQDGNWKHKLTTYAPRVREHGFNPSKDEDVLAYRQLKKEQNAQLPKEDQSNQYK